jgi:hypothetical protein
MDHGKHEMYFSPTQNAKNKIIIQHKKHSAGFIEMRPIYSIKTQKNTKNIL